MSQMAQLKVFSPSVSTLSDLLGPLPTEEDVYETWPEDPTESVNLEILRSRLEEEVRLATNDAICLSSYLLDQVASDVLLLTKDEPCGLRGCMVLVMWDDSNNGIQQLAQVRADDVTPMTHLLVLTLQPDASWYKKMARMIRSKERRQLSVSPRYELVKRRLFNFDDY